MFPPLPVSRRSLLGAGLALPAAGLVACTGGEPETDPGENPPDRVIASTAFGTFGREAALYVAKANGYFADAGLEVEIQPGNGTVDNLALLLGGAVQFTIGDLTGGIVFQGQGDRETGFKAIRAVHQRPLIGVMVLEESGIVAPLDLHGKTLADAPGSVGKQLWPAYARQAGIDQSLVRLEDVDAPDLPGALASGAVDAIGQFAVGVPTIEAAADGRKALFFGYGEFLSDVYGNALYTSNDLLSTDPGLVGRFADAYTRGLEWAVTNPAEAGQILVDEVGVGPGPEVAAAELELMESYSLIPNIAAGEIDRQRVVRSISVCESLGLTPDGTGAVVADDVVAFDFVPGGGE